MTATMTRPASWPTRVAALQSAELDVEAAHLESLSTDSAAAALIPLVNDVVRAAAHGPEKQWVLVLDDYHAIGASAIHEAVAFLLEHLPDQLHLIMATRSIRACRWPGCAVVGSSTSCAPPIFASPRRRRRRVRHRFSASQSLCAVDSCQSARWPPMRATHEGTVRRTTGAGPG